MYLTPPGSSRRSWAVICSVSREAVPLPMAMWTTPCFRISPFRVSMASRFFFSEKVG